MSSPWLWILAAESSCSIMACSSRKESRARSPTTHASALRIWASRHMLKVTDLVAGYGSIRALDGVSINVPEGSIVALFGSNGAGKTTLMHTIAGLMHPIRGTIVFADTAIQNEPAHRIFARGIALVPQGRQLFPEMSVRENLELGGLSALPTGEVAVRIEDILKIFPR